MKVTLKILKKDTVNNNFLDIKDCPLARAAKRVCNKLITIHASPYSVNGYKLNKMFGSVEYEELKNGNKAFVTRTVNIPKKYLKGVK